ncbi:MAG: metallophosphoesterase family protein [Acidaminococcus sp.]|jgi:hypothetical protein|nr:metallophosphoesterase family protein [Acidaminococcus sp.]MCI2099809.1 metallophosphoesterase family protein [Acidaminococcus sp.]MCI2114037.1 metallophosphoesterase family protein [Acidaminococcus sp.]MCI2115907.1 metallophosphoesterase family protein [Acidaminococcus sp.]
MRKKLLGIAALLVAVCALAFAFVPGLSSQRNEIVHKAKSLGAHYNLTNEADVAYVRQIMTKDPSTSRTIMWQSEYEENGSLVEFRKKGASEGSSVDAENTTFTDDKVTRYLHVAQLTGLEPGTDYEYRVGYGDKRSNWYPLRTLNSSTFTALIFPDSQSADYTGWDHLAKKAYKDHPEASFFVNMGDLVDNGEQHSQWDAWFNAVSPMIEEIPVAPIMGNHETYNMDWKVRRPEAFLHLFELPSGDAEHYKNEFYSFDVGDVHFVVLNTQQNELNDWEPNLTEDQIAWFRKDMEASQKKWKVVLMHKDPLQYSFAKRPQPRPEGFSDEGRTWMPLFDEYHVDLVLSAHLHTYRDRGHLRNFARSSEGPYYILTGIAGDVQYKGLWKTHALDEYEAPQPEDRNYLVLEATPDKLTINGYTKTGELMHTSVVEK